MKIYNAVGYAILLAYAAACMLLAPPHLGPWIGLSVGMTYLTASWFCAGLYLSCVIHMGIAHRALDYQEWFAKSLTVVNNTFGIYVNPVTWVNRHRLHHRYADHAGDPNKLASDGFWRTLYLCLFPYKTEINVANDAILATWPFRLAANPIYFVVAQTLSFLLLWWLPLATFVAVKQLSGSSITVVAIAVTIVWSHRIACQEGIVTAPRGRRTPIPV